MEMFIKSLDSSLEELVETQAAGYQATHLIDDGHARGATLFCLEELRVMDGDGSVTPQEGQSLDIRVAEGARRFSAQAKKADHGVMPPDWDANDRIVDKFRDGWSF